MNEKKELITAVVQYRSRANEKRVQAQAGIPMFYYLLSYRASYFRRAEMELILTLGLKRCSLL